MTTERAVIEINSSVFGKNDEIANLNRSTFGGLLVLNVLSSPGSGKTTLLEKTLASRRFRGGVVVGDLATERDADRLKPYSGQVQAITTGRTCHLDAKMVSAAVEKLDIASLDLLFVENVGNLVCPASFDLGEDSRVVLLSVTEGEDKPLKYPVIFRLADLVLITKIDLAGAVGFNRQEATENVRRSAPGAAILELSARTGQGMDEWLSYLDRRIAQKKVKRA